MSVEGALRRTPPSGPNNDGSFTALVVPNFAVGGAGLPKENFGLLFVDEMDAAVVAPKENATGSGEFHFAGRESGLVLMSPAVEVSAAVETPFRSLMLSAINLVKTGFQSWRVSADRTKVLKSFANFRISIGALSRFSSSGRFSSIGLLKMIAMVAEVGSEVVYLFSTNTKKRRRDTVRIR